jgi:signal transduction histidine kinase
MLAVLARALDLERAAVLLEETPGGPLLRRAAHGAVGVCALAPGAPPPDGPWSASLPIGAGRRPAGLVLLARAGGAPLGSADEALAARFAECVTAVAEHGRLRADLARARDLLAHADRLSTLGMLAASVAHEIRNPLVSVRTFMQLLPEREHDEQFRTEFREVALLEVERITELVADVLSFARPVSTDAEPTDLNEIAIRTTRLLDTQVRARGVTLRRDLDPTLPAVVADGARVRQVLTNVVLNAIEAAGQHGHVTLRTCGEGDRSGRWCVVEVADSGPGVAADEAERLFEPFFTTKRTGHGLGLFVASHIMAAHGGDIGVANRDGGGALFRLRFPMPAEDRDADTA